jgi:cell division septation protein DedD
VGGIRIQLAAHRDAAAAEAAWKKLQHGHGDVLGPLVLNLERADLGDKGVFYRLQAGPFTDRVAASAACEQLKARNLGCIVAGK